MKRSFFVGLILLTVCSWVKAQMTVEDYYHLISSDYFLCDQTLMEDSKVGRRNLLRISDKANNYIEAELSLATLYVTIYRDKEVKKDIVFVYANCGPGCECNFLELRYYYEDGEWESAADKFPFDQIEEYIDQLSTQLGYNVYYDLRIPQKRNVNIEAYEHASDHKLFDLVWDGKRFNMILAE